MIMTSLFLIKCSCKDKSFFVEVGASTAIFIGGVTFLSPVLETSIVLCRVTFVVVRAFVLE